MNETIAREQMAKLITRHLEHGGTPNRRDFAEWMLKTSGYTVRNDRERQAFLTAAMLADSAYKVFQAAKPTSTRYAAAAKPVAAKAAAKATAPVAAKPAATRKPRARKATRSERGCPDRVPASVDAGAGRLRRWARRPTDRHRSRGRAQGMDSAVD